MQLRTDDNHYLMFWNPPNYFEQQNEAMLAKPEKELCLWVAKES